MRILISGVAGFIGSNLADAIPPEHTLFGLDNLMRGSESERNLKQIRRTFEFIKGDVRNAREMYRAVRSQRIELIYHLAALPSHRLVFDHEPLDYYSTNLTGTLNVLDAARSVGTRVVFASTNKVSGHQAVPFSENGAKQPDGMYGLTKACAEDFMREFAKHYGVDSVATRFYHAVGKRCHPDLVLRIFTTAALAGEPLIVNGKANEAGQFTYCYADFTAVEDIVRALLLFIERAWKGFDVFNLGAGKMYSVLELAQMILMETNSSSPLQRGIAREHESLYHLADTTKAKRELGWKAAIPLEESVKNYVAWHKNL